MDTQLTIPADAEVDVTADASVDVITSTRANMDIDPRAGVDADPMPARQLAAGAAHTALSADVFGALINLSGRRRFTSQRVVLYAVLASLGHDGAEATARATLAQLCDAHTTLMEGKGSLPGVFSGQLHDAYFGTLQGDRNIRAFISLAGLALDAIAGNGVGAPVLLDQLVRSATPLLSVLNGLTLVYEEQAKRHAQTQRRQLRDAMRQVRGMNQQVRQLAFNAQVVAARAGHAGRDCAAVAASMTALTAAIDEKLDAAVDGLGA